MHAALQVVLLCGLPLLGRSKCSPNPDPLGKNRAVAVITGADQHPGVSGTVTFEQDDCNPTNALGHGCNLTDTDPHCAKRCLGPITVTVDVTGTDSGEFGFHVHQWGDDREKGTLSGVGWHFIPSCSPSSSNDGGIAALDHDDTEGDHSCAQDQSHGFPPSHRRQPGDMGNLTTSSVSNRANNSDIANEWWDKCCLDKCYEESLQGISKDDCQFEWRPDEGKCVKTFWCDIEIEHEELKNETHCHFMLDITGLPKVDNDIKKNITRTNYQWKVGCREHKLEAEDREERCFWVSPFSSSCVKWYKDDETTKAECLTLGLTEQRRCAHPPRQDTGYAVIKKTLLIGQNKMSLTDPARSIIGRSCVIHQREDDGSQPFGNAGLPQAYGVIGIANQNDGGIETPVTPCNNAVAPAFPPYDKATCVFRAQPDDAVTVCKDATGEWHTGHCEELDADGQVVYINSAGYDTPKWRVGGCTGGRVNVTGEGSNRIRQDSSLADPRPNCETTTFNIAGWAFLEHTPLTNIVELKAFLLGLPIGTQSWHFHDYGDLRLRRGDGNANFGEIYHTNSVPIELMETTADMCGGGDGGACQTEFKGAYTRNTIKDYIGRVLTVHIGRTKSSPTVAWALCGITPPHGTFESVNPGNEWCPLPPCQEEPGPDPESIYERKAKKRTNPALIAVAIILVVMFIGLCSFICFKQGLCKKDMWMIRSESSILLSHHSHSKVPHTEEVELKQNNDLAETGSSIPITLPDESEPILETPDTTAAPVADSA